MGWEATGHWRFSSREATWSVLWCRKIELVGVLSCPPLTCHKAALSRPSSYSRIVSVPTDRSLTANLRLYNALDLVFAMEFPWIWMLTSFIGYIYSTSAQVLVLWNPAPGTGPVPGHCLACRGGVIQTAACVDRQDRKDDGGRERRAAEVMRSRTMQGAVGTRRTKYRSPYQRKESRYTYIDFFPHVFWVLHVVITFYNLMINFARNIILVDSSWTLNPLQFYFTRIFFPQLDSHR